MGVSAFEPNAVIRVDGSDYRLLRKVSDTIWQTEDIKNKRIREYEHPTLESLLAAHKLTFRNEAAVPFAPVQVDISQEHMEVAKLRRMYVLKTLEIPNTRSALEAVILEVWNQCHRPQRPPGYVTVYRWKNRYIASGNDIRSLLDNTANKGNRESRYPEEVLGICRLSIDSIYLTKERRTIKDACDDAVLRVQDENRLRPPDMALPLPTRRLIKRLLDYIPERDKYVARHGSDAARHKFRSVTQHRVTQAPLDRAELDHTILDLFVVDDKNFLPLGRPYLTICLDDFTRCALGIYVGFEPPSYYSVAQCLKNAFLPKVRIRQEYPEVTCDWPAYGVMRELVMDNGAEFHSASLDALCGSLGIEMHYAPCKQPWFRGKVERFFGTINHQFAHAIPGTSFSSVAARGDYDPQKHAILPLSELKCLIHKWIADVYHQQPHKGLGGTTPFKKWVSSISKEDIHVPSNPAELDVLIGKADERVLTHKGIQLNGLLYNSPALTALRCSEGNRIKVSIRVDEADLGQIFVISPTTGESILVTALDSDYAHGLSNYQHRVCCRYAREQNLKDGPGGWLEAKRELSLQIEELMLGRKRLGKRIARFLGDSRSDQRIPGQHESDWTAASFDHDATSEIRASVRHPATRREYPLEVTVEEATDDE